MVKYLIEQNSRLNSLGYNVTIRNPSKEKKFKEFVLFYEDLPSNNLKIVAKPAISNRLKIRVSIQFVLKNISSKNIEKIVKKSRTVLKSLIYFK